MRGRGPLSSRGRPGSGRAPCLTRRSMRRGNDRSGCSVADPGITSRGCRSLRSGTSSKTPTTRRPRGCPAPQRRALAIALLREEPAAPLDRGAVSAAFVTFLRERSRTGQVLVVVDDVQWLDRPTASALTFAIRRLRDEPVGLILALRSGGSGPVPLGLDRALSPQRLRHIALGPLSLGALQAMFRARLGRSWPRPLLRRIHENSGGNPFFALEIARALERDSVSPGSALPVPRDLEELLRARIDVLPASSRSALLVASVSSHPTPDLVAAATGLDRAKHDALAAAERAGVVEIQAGQVRFTHPLLASTVYAGASPLERRVAHRALAVSAMDPEERARHLALASEGPDASIASALDDAARLARARGAPDSAAQLAALAKSSPHLRMLRRSFAAASRRPGTSSTPVTRSARKSCSWRWRLQRPEDPRGPTSYGASRTPRGWRWISSGDIFERPWTTGRGTCVLRAGSGWISRGHGSMGAMSPGLRRRPGGPWRSPSASRTHR